MRQPRAGERTVGGGAGALRRALVWRARLLAHVAGTLEAAGGGAVADGHRHCRQEVLPARFVTVVTRGLAAVLSNVVDARRHLAALRVPAVAEVLLRDARLVDRGAEEAAGQVDTRDTRHALARLHLHARHLA